MPDTGPLDSREPEADKPPAVLNSSRYHAPTTPRNAIAKFGNSTGDLPTRGRLGRSAALVAMVAAVLLIVVVLPAERGIDPTGIGRVIGLTEMGEIKAELEAELAEEAIALEIARLADSADAAESTAMVLDSARARDTGVLPPRTGRADVTTVIVPAAGGIEFAAEMRGGARMRYSWSTGGAVVDYAVIGDSTRFERGPAHLYSRGYGRTSKVGLIVAAFDGEHGWYFRNTTDSAATVTIHTSGAYAGLRTVNR